MKCPVCTSRDLIEPKEIPRSYVGFCFNCKIIFFIENRGILSAFDLEDNSTWRRD